MRPRHFALMALVVLTSCAPDAVTEQGREINSLYTFFLYAAAAVFALVAGLIGWSIIRYRERAGQSDLPTQTHTNIGLEITWFVIPTLLVVALFFFSVQTSWRLGHEEGTGSIRTIEVEAFQWGWNFDYGDGVVVTSLPQDRAEMVVPIDRPLRLELSSPDVIHNFWVPRFITKRDILPGRVNQIDFTVAEEGVFRGVCAEFCGLLHHEMDFAVRAVPSHEFDAWLEEQSDAD